MSSGDVANAGWLRPVEQPFYRRAEDFVNSVLREQNWRLTDFLTPRELQILESVVRRENCVLSAYGGALHCERVRAYIMPDNWNPEPEDFAIVILEVTKLEGMLSHGAVLGSILGTGIDRRKIGDIEVTGHSALVAVCQDIVPYLKNNWIQVGRDTISLCESDAEAFQGPEYESLQVSVASERIDALIGACCHWSRTKAKDAITSGDVQLNFAEVTSPDDNVTVGDIVSIRHFGRIRVFETLGESRKGRLRLLVGMLKSRG